MKKATPILLTLSLLINIALGVLLYLGTEVLIPEAEESLAEIKMAGTYGPEGIRVVEGDAVISSAGVVLQNTLITGNLVLTEDIGEGSLELKNVTVKGSTVVQGGGEASILLEDTSLEEMVVNRPGKKVRITARGTTSVRMVILETGAVLEEETLEAEARGFMAVVVRTEEEIDLAGNFTEVTLEGEKARVMVKAGRVNLVLVKEGAKSPYIEFSPGTEVGKLELKTAVEIAGDGSVEETEIRGIGLNKLAGKFGRLMVGGQGIFVEFTKGRAETLTVEPSEGIVSIQVPENVVVAVLEINGKASVTGQGSIERALINHEGVTIDQTPDHVELAKDITALVGGKELPEIIVAPKPTPRVTISSIKSQTLGAPGTTLKGSTTLNVSVTPSDARISATSSNTGVARVTVSEKTLTINALKEGSAKITVTGNKTGYTSRSVTFTVTVVAPTAIRSFIVGEDELTLGKKVVIVKLYASDPQNYNVFLKGNPMKYLAGEKSFYIEAPTADAVRNNVRVYAK